MLTQDSMGLILREVEIIIMEKMHFMKDTPRVQASYHALHTQRCM